MDRFDRRIRELLRREFDAQRVDTLPPDRARYGRRASGGMGPRWVLLRVPAVVTIALAVSLLAAVSLAPRLSGPLDRVRHVSPPPAATAPTAAPATAPASTPAPPPSPAATSTPVRPSASAPPSAPAPAFSDDFSTDPVGANPPAGWTVDEGRWDGVVDDGGHVVRHEASQPLAHLVTGSARWSDYGVSAGVRTGLLGLGSAGVAARYQDSADYDECGLAAGRLELRRVRAGQPEVLDAAIAVSLDPATFHTIRLDARGSQLTCSLDGTPLLHGTDASFSSGRVALVASAGQAADFATVRVTG